MEVTKATVITAPNAISIVGYALVHDGIRRGITTPVGVSEVFWGRVADLADGQVARLTGQTSDFGARLDATLDKKAGLEILSAVSEEGLIPQTFGKSIKSQEYANMLVTGLAWALHPKRSLESSKAGKRSTALKGATAGSYALAETVKAERPLASKAIRLAGHLMGTVGIYYHGTKATDGYTRRVF